MLRRDEDLYIIKGYPLYQNVARDPRYAAFLRKMKLPEWQRGDTCQSLAA